MLLPFSHSNTKICWWRETGRDIAHNYTQVYVPPHPHLIRVAIISTGAVSQRTMPSPFLYFSNYFEYRKQHTIKRLDLHQCSDPLSGLKPD